MKRIQQRFVPALLALTIIVCAPSLFAQTRNADDGLVVSGLDDQGRVRLVPGRSTVITTSRPQKRISIGEPAVVDVVGISPTRIMLTARKPGSTEVIIWDDDDRSQSIDVLVQSDVAALREQFQRQFPQQNIEVTTSGDNVILSGTVSNLEAAEQAQLMSKPYGKEVLNMLEVVGGQQVLLQVKVAEVSRSATRQLGVNFGFIDGPSIFGSNVGQVSALGFKEIGVGELILGVPDPAESVTLFGKGEVGSTAFAYFVSALRDNNLLRILAEPNLVAISGQEATFLAGGEFPVPVPQTGTGNNTTITIQFKEFGVLLKFVPIVLGDGRIRLKLSPEVSDLDFSTAVRFGGFVVPGLTQRKVTTTVEIRDGQTVAVAGLLSSTVTGTKSVTPLLGDVPIIGALFRSVRYQRKETDLVVMVTPRIISPLGAGKVPPGPGENWRHPSEMGLFLNQDLGSEAAADSKAKPSAEAAGPRKFYGQAGFVPAGAKAEAQR